MKVEKNDNGLMTIFGDFDAAIKRSNERSRLAREKTLAKNKRRTKSQPKHEHERSIITQHP